jgi:hypothetical protein
MPQPKFAPGPRGGAYTEADDFNMQIEHVNNEFFLDKWAGGGWTNISVHKTYADALAARNEIMKFLRSGAAEDVVTATDTNIHTCSYYCHRPECIKAQRDELRDRMAAPQGEAVAFMSPKQIPLIVDRDDESGVYIPMRKTPRGNFTMPLYTAPQPAAGVEGVEGVNYANKESASGRRIVELRSDLRGSVPVGIRTDRAMASDQIPSLTDKLWASNEVMSVNAELGLTIDQLVRLSRAVLKATQPEPQGERAQLIERLTASADWLEHGAKVAVVPLASGPDMRRAAALLSAAPAVRGPLTELDVRGMLASRLSCWHRLSLQEAYELVELFSAHHIGKPEPVGINGLTEAETAASASVMGLVRTPVELCSNCQPDGRCMKRQALCYANGTAQRVKGVKK